MAATCPPLLELALKLQSDMLENVDLADFKLHLTTVYHLVSKKFEDDELSLNESDKQIFKAYNSFKLPEYITEDLDGFISKEYFEQTYKTYRTYIQKQQGIPIKRERSKKKINKNEV